MIYGCAHLLMGAIIKFELRIFIFIIFHYLLVNVPKSSPFAAARWLTSIICDFSSSGTTTPFGGTHTLNQKEEKKNTLKTRKERVDPLAQKQKRTSRVGLQTKKKKKRVEILIVDDVEVLEIMLGWKWIEISLAGRQEECIFFFFVVLLEKELGEDDEPERETCSAVQCFVPWCEGIWGLDLWTFHSGYPLVILKTAMVVLNSCAGIPCIWLTLNYRSWFGHDFYVPEVLITIISLFVWGTCKQKGFFFRKTYPYVFQIELLLKSFFFSDLFNSVRNRSFLEF